MVWDENVIGRNRFWMKVSLDEPVLGWKCRGWNCLLFWMKWFWTKEFLEESVFEIWMKVYLTLGCRFAFDIFTVAQKNRLSPHLEQPPFDAEREPWLWDVESLLRYCGHDGLVTHNGFVTMASHSKLQSVRRFGYTLTTADTLCSTIPALSASLSCAVISTWVLFPQLVMFFQIQNARHLTIRFCGESGCWKSRIVSAAEATIWVARVDSHQCRFGAGTPRFLSSLSPCSSTSAQPICFTTTALRAVNKLNKDGFLNVKLPDRQKRRGWTRWCLPWLRFPTP